MTGPVEDFGPKRTAPSCSIKSSSFGGDPCPCRQSLASWGCRSRSGNSIETIVDVMAGTVPLGIESLKNAMVKKLAELKAAETTKQAKAG